MVNLSSFTRTSGNLAQMGYFPTSKEDCEAIGSRLNGYGITMLDPCCGEGKALKSISTELMGYGESLGIEIENGRAEKAKEKLTAVINEDFFNLSIESKAFGAVFLNPPYHTNEELHYPFIEKATEVLAIEGILILVIPDYEVSGKTSGFLESHYETPSVYRAIDRKFKQIIYFGKKKKNIEIKDGKELERLTAKAEEISPESAYGKKYKIPSTKNIEEVRIHTKSIDPEKIKALLDNFQDDWKKLEAMIPESTTAKRPLLPLRKGHLAQILASGLIDGEITHPFTGEKYLIKGTTNRIEEAIEETEDEIKMLTKDVVTILMLDQKGTLQKIK